MPGPQNRESKPDDDKNCEGELDTGIEENVGRLCFLMGWERIFGGRERNY